MGTSVRPCRGAEGHVRDDQSVGLAAVLVHHHRYVVTITRLPAASSNAL